MKRIFLDANAIFAAAHNPQGKAALLFELFGGGHWKLITSQLAWEEARRNLTIKFPESISRLKKLHQDLEILANSGPRPCPIELPAKDQPIFLAAVQAQATHLLTGDKAHFGSYMNKSSETQKIIIQTVADFFRDLIEKNE